MVQNILKQHGQIIFLRIEFIFFIFKIPRKYNLLQFVHDPDNRFLIQLVDSVPAVNRPLALIVTKNLPDQPANFPFHVNIHNAPHLLRPD